MLITALNIRTTIITLMLNSENETFWPLQALISFSQALVTVTLQVDGNVSPFIFFQCEFHFLNSVCCFYLIMLILVV